MNPTLEEVRAEIARRKAASEPATAAPVAPPAVAAGLTLDAIRAEKARRAAANNPPIEGTYSVKPAPAQSNGAGLGPVNPMVAEGQRAQRGAVVDPQRQPAVTWSPDSKPTAPVDPMYERSGAKSRGWRPEQFAAVQRAKSGSTDPADIMALRSWENSDSFSAAPARTAADVEAYANAPKPAEPMTNPVKRAARKFTNVLAETGNMALEGFDFARGALEPGPRISTLDVPEAQNVDQAIPDVIGTIGGYVIPGSGVSKVAQAGGQALRGVGAIGNAARAITPQGANALAKATRVAGRVAATVPENAIHAAALGAIMGGEGNRLETAGEFAADPINYVAQPAIMLLNRAGIFLRTAGQRATPEFVQVQRAEEILRRANATPAEQAAAARVIDELTPPLPAGAAQPQAPVQPAAQAVQPPAQTPPTAPAVTAGAPQPGPVPPAGTLTPAGNGIAVDSYNALPVKTREGILRALEASGMNRQQAFDAITSLNDLPPDRANMFEFELIRRYGGPDQFPNLQANLTAMGSDFSIQTGKKGGSPQEVMNKSLLEQAQSEGDYLTRTAEQLFGEGKVATKEQLEAFRTQLGGRYRAQLAQTYPGLTRLRSQASKDALGQAVDAGRKNLTDYLLRPDVIEQVPPWVQDQVMMQISDDLRWLQKDDAGLQFASRANPELTPLLTSDQTLRYSPQLWRTLVQMYPTQVGHSLQSAYRAAIDDAFSGLSNAVDRTTAKRLMRLRGQSRVRANAADPNKRGFGLLHLIEEASPGYKELRQQYGDVVGAQKAADMPNNFFRIAKDEEALADFADVFDNELTPLQQDAVRNGITTQIRQALKNKTEFTQPWELDAIERGQLPNLTAISSQSFLEALPRVFGRDGEMMADAIRLSRANIDNIQAINKNFASGTPKGIEIRENARNLYESKAASNLNPIDNATSTMAGVGAFSAFAPGGQVISAAALGGAAMRGLYRAYKRGKSLSPAEKEALAEWLFKPRRETDAPPPTTPSRFSKLGYAGNVATGAAIGGTAGAVTSEGDPGATAQGALYGAIGGGARAGLRAIRAERSIIKPPPAARGNRLRGGPNPPPAGPAVTGPNAPRPIPGQQSNASPAVTGALVGGAAGYAAAPEDQRGLGLVAGAVGGGVLGNRLAKAGKTAPKAPAGRGGAPNLPPAAPAAAMEARPAASVSSVPQSRTVAKVRMPNGADMDVPAEVFTNGDKVIMSPVWPTNMGDDLEAALKQRQAGIRAEERGMRLVNDAPQSPDWATQNPKEWADVQRQIGERFIGMVKSNPGPAHVLALVDGVDMNTLGSIIEAGMPRGSQLLRSQGNGEFAVVSRSWLRDNPKQFQSWEKEFPAYNQAKGLRPPPAEWSGIQPKSPRPANDAPASASKPTQAAALDLTPSGSPRSAAIGDARVKYFVENGVLTLQEINVPSFSSGKGQGSRAIDAIIAQADAEGLPIRLIPHAYGHRRLSDGDLKNLYLSRGFKEQTGDWMRREPGASAASASKPPPNALKGKPSGPSTASRMVAGGVVGGVAGSLGGDAQAQEDLTAEMAKVEGQISTAEQEIAALKKAKADFDKITDPFKKQQFLKDAGLYPGKVDGINSTNTTNGINAWEAKNAAALKKAEDDRAASKAGLADLKKQVAYRQIQKEQSPFLDAARDLGPSGAMILASIAAGVLRYRGVGKSAKAVKVIENDINDLITKGPVKSLMKKGGVANTERNRAVNMNQFYREGSAPNDKLPFNYGKDGWKPNQKAAKPGSLFPSKELEKRDGVGSTLIRPTDIKVIGAGVADSAVVTPFVASAEEELKNAEQDVRNGNESIEALRRVERAKTNLAMFQAIQRIGWGVTAGGLLSMGYRYKLPKPDIRGAEEEVTAITDFLKSKAPPKPPKPSNALRPPPPPPPPVAGPSNQMLLPLLPPPPPKPKPKPKKP